MKTVILTISILLCLGCANKTDKTDQVNNTEAAVKQTPKKTSKGTVELSIDGKIYVYDNINWESSYIKKGKDLNLRILHKGLPSVEFRFPDAENSLTNELTVFTIPDMKRGLKQLILKFFDDSKEVEDRLNKYIVFRKGEIQAELEGDNLIVNFKGLGGPMRDSKTIYPISGSLHINI